MKIVLRLGAEGDEPQTIEPLPSDQTLQLDTMSLSSEDKINSLVERLQNVVSAQLQGSQFGGVAINADGIKFEVRGSSGEIKGKSIGSPISEEEDGNNTIIQVVKDPIEIDRPSASECQRLIKEEFEWAWNAYKTYAWGHDDVKPLSRSFEDNYGMALTMIDSLDTMLLMGMKEEFEDCIKWISKHLEFSNQKDINLFETTIRVMGGLLGAYSIDNRKILLDKAIELADAMLMAFDTPTGIPYGTLNLEEQNAHNPAWTNGYSTVAEVGSIQMEFRYLSKLTGNSIYKEKVDKATQSLKKSLDKKGGGLYTQFVHPITGELRPGVITLGARVDSIYEYYLKLWIMEDATDKPSRDLYEYSMRHILKELTLRSTVSGMVFVAEKNGNTLSGKMDHLVCFLPGLMALDYSFRKIKEKNESSVKVEFPGDAQITLSDAGYMKIARELGETCFEFYRQSPSGLAPEIVQFASGSDKDFVIDAGAPHSLLRPEAVESFFHLFRATGDTIWRDRAWKVFIALKKWARVSSGGYANLKDVRWTGDPDSNQNDRMESFFLSETLKYLFLIFDDGSTLPTSKYVFNTEAHAFPVSSVTS